MELCLFRFDSLQNDLGVFFFTFLILVYALASYTRFSESKDFKKGKNLIFRNRYKLKVLSNENPITFEIVIPYTPSIGGYTILFFCAIATLFFYGDYYVQVHGVHLFFFVGVGSIVLLAYHYFKQRRRQREYRDGVFKIGTYGVWTNKLGAVPWGDINEISIYYVTKYDKYSSDNSHLEICAYGNRRDQIKLYEIGKNKNKTKEVIELYARAWLGISGPKNEHDSPGSIL